MTLPGSRSSLPSVQFERFDGPLDLLVEEVRRQNVAIEKIAMAPIVSRFLTYLESAAARSINLDIEWLHMAAILIHWKSRSLVASERSLSQDADPIRDQLVQELLAHRGQAAEALGRRQATEQARFSRFHDPEFQEPPQAGIPREAEFVTVWDLIASARELAAWAENQREERSRWRETLGVESDDVSVMEMISYLRARLPEEDVRLDGVRLLGEQANASRRACLFLGMLQMAADQELQLEQNVEFGPIWLSCGRGG